MGTEYYDVKSFVKEWKAEIKKEVDDGIASGHKRPSLTIVQIGDNPASNKYVDNKIKDCKEVGIFVDLYRVPEGSYIDQGGLNNLVYNCETDGIIIQLPVPEGLKPIDALWYTDSKKDVDGFMPGSGYVPATTLGIIKFLDSVGLGDGSKKNALVIGRSLIVGKPTARQLLDRNWTVEIAHSRTEDLWRHFAGKSLIVSAVGRHGVVDLRQVPAGCTVIDVGINFVDGKMVGDCAHADEALNVKVTPVPGGVGLLTRAALLENVVKAWKAQWEPEKEW